MIVGVPVYPVVDSLVVSLLGVISFGSVLLGFVVVVVVVIVVVVSVVVVIVWVADLENEQKCYRLIAFLNCFNVNKNENAFSLISKVTNLTKACFTAT